MKAVTATHILVDDTWQKETCLLVEGGVIHSVLTLSELPPNLELEDLGDGFLAPGFFDIQVNGGGDILINDDPSPENILTVANAHLRFGSTSILPTLITDQFDKMKQMAESVAALRDQGHSGIRGIHFEGPFINEKRKGVHHASYIRNPEEAFIDLVDQYDFGVCLVTLAPEKVPADFLKELIKRNAVVSIGHTEADYDTCLNAIGMGVTGFTHLFNAMPAFLSRAPGPIGAAFQSKDIYAGVIADGHHIHPASLKSALSLLTPRRSILVTDAMPPVGGKKDQFILEDLEVLVCDGKCVTNNGTLAGAAISMEDAVRYVVRELGLPLSDAVIMASQTPARFMGLSDQIGSFKNGTDADFVLLNSAGKIQSVHKDSDK